MKKSVKQLGDQFEKISREELDDGREKGRARTGPGDLTSDQQAFQPKAPETTGGWGAAEGAALGAGTEEQEFSD